MAHSYNKKVVYLLKRMQYFYKYQQQNMYKIYLVGWEGDIKLKAICI